MVIPTDHERLEYVHETQVYQVKVISKSAVHPYHGTGSSNGYSIGGLESPYLVLIPGNTYKFDQANSTNSGHPFRFYLEAAKTTAYTTGVTTNGTPGSSGAYTQIVVSATTPQILFYQCSAHGFMGSAAYTLNDAIAANAVTSTQIAANAVGTSELAQNSVTAVQIPDSSITATQMGANSVDSSELVDGSIDTVHIADSQITSAKIANGTIVAADLASDAVTNAKIADNSIDSEHYVDGSIDTAHIADSQITGAKIVNGTITTTDIANTTILVGNMAANSIDSNQYVDGSIDRVHLAADIVDGTKIADNAIGAEHIAANAVGASEIAADAVGASEIAANAVGASEIAASAVGASELNVSGNGSTSQFLRSDGDGTMTWAVPTDTNTDTDTGVTAITVNNATSGSGELVGTALSGSISGRTLTLTLTRTFEQAADCLTYNMQVMLSNNILVNVNNLRVGDNIMTTNGNTIIEELIINHMREGYYVINNELEITNDHPIFVNDTMWKRTEDLLVGDVINNVRIDTMEYISKLTPTVSIITESDNYNVHCDENLYTVHGRYRFIKEQENKIAA